jgi:Zinc finger, ZZ type
MASLILCIAPLTVHEGWECDGCKTSPIVGIRWKCLVCDEYDLCDACHSSEAHPVEHQILRIESPEDGEDLIEIVSDFLTHNDEGHSSAIPSRIAGLRR